MKIKDLQNVIKKKFDLVDKKIGVELVDLGFLNYEKLTAINYNYWWYEVADLSKIDKKKFTFDWSDLKETKKMKYIHKLIDFHNENDSGYILLTNILNIDFADGIDIVTKIAEKNRLYDFYYENSIKTKQYELQI